VSNFSPAVHPLGSTSVGSLLARAYMSFLGRPCFATPFTGLHFYIFPVFCTVPWTPAPLVFGFYPFVLPPGSGPFFSPLSSPLLLDHQPLLRMSGAALKLRSHACHRSFLSNVFDRPLAFRSSVTDLRSPDRGPSGGFSVHGLLSPF